MASSDEKEILLQADTSTSHELESGKISVPEGEEDIPPAFPSLRKSLTLINGISFMVNLIVGSGIFTSPGLVLRNSGSIALAFAAWIVAGAIAFCSALVYAELGSSFPSAGGDAHYYEVAFGKLVAYIYVWTLFFVVNAGGTSLIALTFARYAASAVFSFDVQDGNVDSDIRVQALGIGCIVISTIFNCCWVEVRNVLQHTFLLLKFTLVVLLGMAALLFISRNTSIMKQNFSEALKGGQFSGFGPAVIAALWAFMGWNGVNFLTEEMKNPKRDVSRAIFGEIKSSAVIGMEMAKVAIGGQTSQVIAVLVAASALGTLNSSVFYHGRYLYAAARSGYIFSWMGYIGKESGAPCVALITHILNYFGPVSLFFYGLTAAAHMKIRKDLPDIPRPYTIEFYPYIPIFVMFACLYLIVMCFFTNLIPTCLAFGLVLLSLPCYGLSRCCNWKRSNLKASYVS